MAIGRHERAYLNRSAAMDRRIQAGLVQANNGQQVVEENNAALRTSLQARRNHNHLYVAWRAGAHNGSDFNSITANDLRRLEGMSYEEWGEMIYGDQFNFLSEFILLRRDPVTGLVACISFIRGKSIQLLARMNGLRDYGNATAGGYLLSQLGNHYGGRYTLQAEIGSEEQVRRLAARGQFSLAQVGVINYYHDTAIATHEAVSRFQPRGMQEARRNRRLRLAQQRDREEERELESLSESEEEEVVEEPEEEVIVIDSGDENSFVSDDESSSDEEQEPPRNRRRLGDRYSHMHNNAAQDELTGWD